MIAVELIFVLSVGNLHAWGERLADNLSTACDRGTILDYAVSTDLTARTATVEITVADDSVADGITTAGRAARAAAPTSESFAVTSATGHRVDLSPCGF